MHYFDSFIAFVLEFSFILFYVSFEFIYLNKIIGNSVSN